MIYIYELGILNIYGECLYALTSSIRVTTMSPATLVQKETTSTATTIEQMPPELESSNGKLVYLYLTTVEEETISGLKETLDMQELTLFPTLAILEDNGLIERDGETFTIAA